MKLKAFSVRDAATEVFTRPFFMLTKAEAIRTFTKESNDSNSQLFQHPLDYHLFYLGDFDQDTGKFNSVHPEDLGSAQSYKHPDNVVPLGEAPGDTFNLKESKLIRKTELNK